MHFSPLLVGFCFITKKFSRIQSPNYKVFLTCKILPCSQILEGLQSSTEVVSQIQDLFKGRDIFFCLCLLNSLTEFCLKFVRLITC